MPNSECTDSKTKPSIKTLHSAVTHSQKYSGQWLDIVNLRGPLLFRISGRARRAWSRTVMRYSQCNYDTSGFRISDVQNCWQGKKVRKSMAMYTHVFGFRAPYRSFVFCFLQITLTDGLFFFANNKQVSDNTYWRSFVFCTCVIYLCFVIGFFCKMELLSLPYLVLFWLC